MSAEEPRGSHDGVRDIALGQRLLGERLRAVVGQRRVDRRIGNADVDDPPDARKASCLKECFGVGDGVRERRPAPFPSNPVGVVERRDPFEASRQRGGVIQSIRLGFDPFLEGMLSFRVVREGSYRSSGLEQKLGDPRARVAERPRHQVRFGAAADLGRHH